MGTTRKTKRTKRDVRRPEHAEVTWLLGTKGHANIRTFCQATGIGRTSFYRFLWTGVLTPEMRERLVLALGESTVNALVRIVTSSKPRTT